MVDASPPDSVAAVAVDALAASVSVDVDTVAPFVSCADAAVGLPQCAVVLCASPPSHFAYVVCRPV